MSAGLAAPDGYVWCRGSSGAWHFLEATEPAHQGAARTVARSVCGLVASVLPGHDGWAEMRQRAAPEPRRLCAACLARVGERQRRDRSVAPQTTQGRLPL